MAKRVAAPCSTLESRIQDSHVPAGTRVLVVDDDDSIRQVVSLALADEGYLVDAASDGEAALQLVRQRRPDLILLDMRMPVMDGNEFAQAYRGLPGPHAPIIAFVAAFDAAEHGEAIGAAAVLEKPFDLDELLAVVGQLARTDPDPEGATS